MKDLMTTEDFFYIVKEKLQSKTPFSFVRFSDGEIMLLNRQMYEDQYDWAIRKLMGRPYSQQEKAELSHFLKESLRDADIIGFPTKRHLSRADFFADGVPVFDAHIARGHNINCKGFASVDVAYEMLFASKQFEINPNYIDYYRELLYGVDNLHYISCRNLDDRFKSVYNIKNVNSYIIAPEPKFTSGYDGEPHYPDQFNKIKHWIKNLACKGDLCLVGGGVISKIYNTWFKERGGISLDLGAVFDLWDGKATRGKERGLDKEINDYKL